MTGTIEEMLVRNGVLKFGDYRIAGAAVTNNLVVYDRQGNLTHRVEKSVLGNDLIVRDVRSGLTVLRCKVTTQLV
ncbi:hypothetical protein IJ096_01610 [Candidatus Saccharibacteria bacterium]|nr:hypothetical protein [Candidatus Saccharibacteria bacterium]